MSEARKRPLRIGLSTSMMHPDPARPLFKGKRLLYAEESMFHWVLESGALACLLPSESVVGGAKLADFIAELDGVVMTGGSDVSPGNYGETPLRPEWSGDPHRDAYDIGLVRACLAADKPLLGICRGLQVMNVALGGSLFQDIETQVEGAVVHRNWEAYDANVHGVRIEKGSGLARMYGASVPSSINSVHHQGIKDLATDLTVEARCAEDGLVEAVRWKARAGGHAAPYLFAVQWHPEWHDRRNTDLARSGPILEEFLAAAAARKRT